MSATGLDVFDKTLQTTHIWLGDIMDDLGPDRQVAWRVLGVVLRAIRDRLPVDAAAHLGAQLPLLIRGAYYDQFQPARQPEKWRTLDELLERVNNELSDLRPVNARDAVQTVCKVLSKHIDRGEAEEVRAALPSAVHQLWREGFLEAGPSRESAAR